MAIIVFPDAATARANTTDLIVIHNETTSIETEILAAISAGQLQVDINDTTMTMSTAYFQVWQNTITDRAKTYQMDQVIGYFTQMGYSIGRLLNTSTNNTFFWRIQW